MHGDDMTSTERLFYQRTWQAAKRAVLREKLETWQREAHVCPTCYRPLFLRADGGRREKYCPQSWGFLSKKKPCVGFRLEYS